MTFDPKNMAATMSKSKGGQNKKAANNGQAKNETPTAHAPEGVPQLEADAQAPGQSKEPPAGTEVDRELADALAGNPNDQPPATDKHTASDYGWSAVLEVPIGELTAGYATCRIDFKATPRQAAAAKMLWCSLSKQGARFAGGLSSHPEGTVVDSASGGLRWLLDELADAIEAETGRDLTADYGLIFR